MDVRTKLRIRDSLYRLAQSAEQRLRHANLNNGSGDDSHTSRAFDDDGAYRLVSFLDALVYMHTSHIGRIIVCILQAHGMFGLVSEDLMKHISHPSSLESK